jgi:hypothetical protein
MPRNHTQHVRSHQVAKCDRLPAPIRERRAGPIARVPIVSRVGATSIPGRGCRPGPHSSFGPTSCPYSPKYLVLCQASIDG